MIFNIKHWNYIRVLKNDITHYQGMRIILRIS